jgi:hypothetical protein
MDPVTPWVLAFVGDYAAYLGVAVVLATGAKAFVDAVVRPWVAKTASKRDDEILETYVDPALDLVSRVLSFLSLYKGRK